MNYRHAFHAGNFADVFKHIILTRILVYLTQKPAPLRYLDTHAGVGWYDLDDDAATRTGEWRDGIGRLDPALASPAVAVLLAPYLDAVGPRDATLKPLAYPGSPAIAQHLLRPTDRLTLCELHPQDAPALRTAMKGDTRVKVLTIDGYTALNAAVPPPERRGLVLIDPPFEDRAELTRMADAMAAAHRKWRTGSYALWYPIKEVAAVAQFTRRLRDLDAASWLQLTLIRDGRSGEREPLRGCGLFIINPPYTLHAEADLILPFLVQSFDRRGENLWQSRVQAGTSDAARMTPL